ncbi:hypothetical protein LPB41_28535 [Thalassospira sp. MA62]|nr:hypothetical protein [Thalassospira sp. MA62]
MEHWYEETWDHYWGNLAPEFLAPPYENVQQLDDAIEAHIAEDQTIT